MNKDKIFIVEDDETIVSLLKGHLGQVYDVVSVSNFRAVEQEIEDAKPDLILMDITLPYFNGFYWTTEIRKTATTPIIFISSSDDEMNMVMALNMGGDDYIAKPFSLPILDAKIAAFLRRAQQFSASSADLQVGPFTLTRDGVLTNGQDKVTLSPTENRILSLLMSRQGQVVSKDSLLAHLWENDDFIDQNTLSVNLTRLRKRTAPLGFDRIHTIRGVGYTVK